MQREPFKLYVNGKFKNFFWDCKFVGSKSSILLLQILVTQGMHVKEGNEKFLLFPRKSLQRLFFVTLLLEGNLLLRKARMDKVFIYITSSCFQRWIPSFLFYLNLDISTYFVKKKIIKSQAMPSKSVHVLWNRWRWRILMQILKTRKKKSRRTQQRKKKVNW